MTLLSNFVSLRFDRDIDVAKVLKDVIKSIYFGFLGEKTKDIVIETTLGLELRVFRKPKKRGDPPLATFPMCWYDQHMSEPFIGLAVKKVAGLPRYPLTMNVTLLRNLLNYLNKKKIRYEIW